MLGFFIGKPHKGNRIRETALNRIPDSARDASPRAASASAAAPPLTPDPHEGELARAGIEVEAL